MQPVRQERCPADCKQPERCLSGLDAGLCFATWISFNVSQLPGLSAELLNFPAKPHKSCATSTLFCAISFVQCQCTELNADNTIRKSFTLCALGKSVILSGFPCGWHNSSMCNRSGETNKVWQSVKRETCFFGIIL